jgi:hypothetical protein
MNIMRSKARPTKADPAAPTVYGQPIVIAAANATRPTSDRVGRAAAT